MEATREIYWNVGHGLTTLAPMYLLTLLAIGALAWGCWKRLEIYSQGKPLDRFDQPLARLANMLRLAVLQAKVLRVAGPGLAHALFFWSFGILFIGTVLIVIQADFTDLLFDLRFLTGTFYKVFSLALDLGGLVAIVMLGGLLGRRYLVRPAGLDNSSDDLLMHGLLLAIIVSGFVVEGARMAATEIGVNDALTLWSPVGLVVATMVRPLDPALLFALHRGLWWFHLLLALAFIAVIPFSKFRHLLTTTAGGFFADLGPTGKLVTLDLEDENSEGFGARAVVDFTWKDLFDTDACTQCKRCQDRCPAHATDKPLSPMRLISDLGEAARFKPDSDLADTIGREAIWACTTCRACQDICPASIEHVNKIVELRRRLVLMEGEFPGEEVMTAMEATEVNGNPLGMGYAARADWSEGLGVKILAEDSDIDILYFVGCYASFDKRNIKVAKAFVNLCHAAGLKVGILGKEEKCCGEPMRKMGNEYLYQTLAAENIERIQGYGVKKIVTACPHCYNTLAKDYADLGLNIEVEHHASFLAHLVAEGDLAPSGGDFSCTYHDSCYLGRYNNIYAPPRDLIAAAGGTLTEMAKNRDQAFCCSGGGGRILAEEKRGTRINVHRVEMALSTNAGLLLANCPFCLTMFEDGIKGTNAEDRLAAKDIAEILAERVGH
jgi:Fe-S oxidoreductase/nitrate reductase gamma subunit